MIFLQVKYIFMNGYSPINHSNTPTYVTMVTSYSSRSEANIMQPKQPRLLYTETIMNMQMRMRTQVPGWEVCLGGLLAPRV